jgi:MFS family permease
MSAKTEGIAPNASRLLWAGFMAILAAGVGFAIRGGIFDNWGREFGFTATQLGAIGGAGFSGFCFGIILGGVICDKIGYGKLVVAAFALHVLSAFVTFTAGGATAYASLYWGMFIFAFANGTLEAVANPLIATLYPNNRTHYLNILHASWPAGLIIGGVLGWVLDDMVKLNWKLQLSLYLIPTVVYGVMFLGQHMPKSEASSKGLSLGEMFKDVGVLGGFIVCYLLTLFFQSALGMNTDTAFAIGAVLLVTLGVVSRQNQKPGLEAFAGLAVCAVIAIYFQSAFGLGRGAGFALGLALVTGMALVMRWPLGSFLLFFLFIAHALVGAVELGTDGWIQNITGNILSSEQGKILFVFTSSLMFALRFCADFIEKKIGLSPIGILLVCALLACVGLNLSAGIATFGGALFALTVYAVGKTFFWPTMLAVASDRFPRTGAIAISIMGGIGMLSAGLIGSPGLGYAKDRFAGESLKRVNEPVYEEYKSATPSKFLFFSEVQGLDGKKLGSVQDTVTKSRALLAKGGRDKEFKRLDRDIKDTEAVVAKLDADLKEVNDSIGKTKDDDELEPLGAKKIKLTKKLEKAKADLSGLQAERTRLTEIEGRLTQAGVMKPDGNSDKNAPFTALTPSETSVHKASIRGDRKTLRADSFIPAFMAVIYLLLLIYFKITGGYKAVHLEGTSAAKPTA